MKILQIFNRYTERGGEEISVERISNVLSGHHQLFHCYFDSSTWVDDQQQAKSIFSRLRVLIRQSALMFYNPRALSRFKSQLNACNPDIILIHNIFPIGSIGLYLAIVRSGIPALHYIHNFRPYSVNGYLWAGGRLQAAGLRKNFLPEILSGAWQQSKIKTALYASILWLTHLLGIYRKLDGWLAISTFMQKTFVDAGIPAEKVFLLKHSWQGSMLQLPAIDAASAPESPYFLFLGRITEAKGIKVLLQAWKKVEDADPNARLVIGGDGPEAEWVISQLPQFKNVEFLGFVDGLQKERLLQGCRALMIPSEWWEPLGLVVYEAYQYHRPVITTGSGGLAETVIDGTTGWQYPPGDSDALSACMLSAIHDPDEASARGEAGYHWMTEHTSHTTWLNDFERIAQTVISRRDASRHDVHSLSV